MAKIPIPKFRIPIVDHGASLRAYKDDSAYHTKVHRSWSEQVRANAGYACQRCGRTKTRLFADHIKEIRDGGTWDLTNGQALCGSCHTVKTLAERAKRAHTTYP